MKKLPDKLDKQLLDLNSRLLDGELTASSFLLPDHKSNNPVESAEATAVSDAWVSRSRMTCASDDGWRAYARNLAGKLYAARGWSMVDDSRLVFSPSPFVTMVSVGLLSTYWTSRRTIWPTQKILTTPASKLSWIRAHVPLKVAHQGGKVYDQVLRSCDNLRPMIDLTYQVAIDLLADVLSSDDTLLRSLGSAVRSEMTLRSLEEILASCSGGEAGNFNPSSFSGEVGFENLVVLVGDAISNIDGGNLDAAIPALVDFASRSGCDVGKFPDQLDLRARMAAISGPWVMHPMFCIVGERPETLTVDAGGRLHSESGPAVRWKDGTRLYCLDGVQVKSQFVVDPESTTAEQLENSTIDQRRACFDKAPKREQVLFAIREMGDDNDT